MGVREPSYDYMEPGGRALNMSLEAVRGLLESTSYHSLHTTPTEDWSECYSVARFVVLVGVGDKHCAARQRMGQRCGWA